MLEPEALIRMLGLYPDATAIGLMGAGLRATGMDTLDNRKKTASAILLSAVAAGLIADPAAVFVHVRYPELGPEEVRRAGALIIGVFTPAAVQYGLAFLKRKGGESPQ